MKKFLVFAMATGLLAACGGNSSGTAQSNGVFGTVAVSPVSVQAAQIGATAPDAEPVAAAALPTTEVDSLNPANGVTVTTQVADAEPAPVAPLPASAADPDKPNS